jgi:hypothetical protein
MNTLGHRRHLLSRQLRAGNPKKMEEFRLKSRKIFGGPMNAFVTISPAISAIIGRIAAAHKIMQRYLVDDIA